MSVLHSLAELFPLQRAAVDAARPARRAAFGLAAAVALAFTAGVLLHDRAPAPPAAAQAPAEQRLETPVGVSRTVALRDGSAVVLNTDTELAVQFASGHRDLRLSRGEAHFRVAHDANSPFRVFVAGRTVQAVGTAFSVRLLDDGQVDVMVTEGTVRVESGDGDPVRLVAARQALRLDGAGQGIVRTLEPTEVDVRLAWQRGMLIFQGEPLSSVLDEFARYTTQTLVIADPQLRALRVGGYFRAGDVDALLIALRQNFRIASMRDDRGRILLSAAH
jgi:transmembrane sensor